VQFAKELIAFADAAIGRRESAMQSARSELLNAIGPVGLVDATGVVGNFERMNRIADASGLELDAPVRILSANVRDELGLHNLPSARNTKPSGLLAKFAARMVIPVAARFFSKRKSERRIRSL